MPSRVRRLRRLSLAVLCAAALSLPAGMAYAERRVALVIGNADYQHVPRLRTPTSDAENIVALLRRLDFQVTVIKDADKFTMEQALRQFGENIAGADVALFYYSGHGAQIADSNYILPTSARVDNRRSLALDAFAVPSISSMMRAAGAKVQLLVLDACRNNPFAKVFVPAAADPASAKGLAAQMIGAGTLIAFSAGPGQVALDGDGDVSPFTEGFLKFGGAPNIEIRQMLARVRAFVSDKTENIQIPWDNSSLLQDVYLAPKRAAPQFAQVTRVHLAAAGAGPLNLAKPVQVEGGGLRVKIEQAPASGRLTLDGRDMAAGAELDAGEVAKLAYARAGVVGSDAFSFRVTDDWGHSDLGLVAIDFTGARQPTNARPEPATPRLEASLNAVSLIGLGPNLHFKEAMPNVGGSEIALRLDGDPPFGQFRVGDRVLAKDRILKLAELTHLSYLPPVGVEGKTISARFVAADGSANEVAVNVRIAATDCDRLAGDRLDTQGVTQGVFPGRVDLDAALPACEAAVKAQPGSGRFVYELARVYAGLGRNDEADAAYRRAADLGHIRALWALGYRALYLEPRDEARGVALLERAEASADVFAEHTLGQAYYEGRGVPKDLAQARKLFEKAAQAGHTFSMNSLGRMYQLGESVDPDPALAKRYWEESARRGDVYGLDNLGWAYLDGVDTPKDPAKAMDYFKQASGLGHPEAPNNIGRLYLFGTGVPKNLDEAKRWYALGMSRGDGWAAYNLGEMSRDGIGGPKDSAQAGYDFARAAASPNRPEPAKKGRDGLAALGQPAKMAALRRLVGDLDARANGVDGAALIDLAHKAAMTHKATPAGDSLDDLMVAVAQAIFTSRGVRTDLF